MIKPRGHGRGYTTVGILDTGQNAQEVHNPASGEQGGPYEQDRSSHNPDSGGQGGAEDIGTEKAVADKAAFLLPAVKAGVPVRGTGAAPHGDEGFRVRKDEPPRMECNSSTEEDEADAEEDKQTPRRPQQQEAAAQSRKEKCE